MENKNMLQKLFGFNSHSMQVRTEILAGITTFLTMSYILAVNPLLLWRYGPNFRSRLLPAWD